MPCLVSIHPNTAKVTAEMEKAAGLGQRTRDADVVRSKPWFTSDAPANVYARAILSCVELNQHLDPLEAQQKEWDLLDRKAPQRGERTRLLPFPKYIAGLELLPVPITPAGVHAYWCKGKEMISEEMPDFQLRAEWNSYLKRTYKHGAKSGAVQHAIFKDILTALRTIAGGNKTGRTARPPKPKHETK